MTEIPKTSAPAKRALDASGVLHLEDLSRFTEKEVSELHGMGPKVMNILKQAMEAAGISFAK